MKTFTRYEWRNNSFWIIMMHMKRQISTATSDFRQIMRKGEQYDKDEELYLCQRAQGRWECRKCLGSDKGKKVL